MGREPSEEDALCQDKKEVREEKLMSERSGAVLASQASLRGPQRWLQKWREKNQTQGHATEMWDAPEQPAAAKSPHGFW